MKYIADRAIYASLNRAGFKRAWASRSKINGNCCEYMRGTESTFAIIVQLWSDHGHRVSHWLNGRMTTTPIDFKTLPEMIAAIKKEESYAHNPSAN